MPNDGAETFDVEVRVLELQRVKGPFNQIDAAIESVFALRQLKQPPHPAVLIFVDHTDHVRVQVGESLAYRRKGQGKTDGRVAVKSCHNLSACFPSDDTN